jgi:hypothetical protein
VKISSVFTPGTGWISSSGTFISPTASRWLVTAVFVMNGDVSSFQEIRCRQMDASGSVVSTRTAVQVREDSFYGAFETYSGIFNMSVGDYLYFFYDTGLSTARTLTTTGGLGGEKYSVLQFQQL